MPKRTVPADVSRPLAEGIVVSVNLCKDNYPNKIPRGSAGLGTHGFLKDYHNRARRPDDLKKDRWVPNERHISILSREALSSLNRFFKLKELQAINPGRLGENITVERMGRLSKLPTGTHIHLGVAITLEVVGYMEPAVDHVVDEKLSKASRDEIRGLFCRILPDQRGHEVKAGLPIKALPPQK